MLSQNELSIIIKAVDEASSTINHVKDELNGIQGAGNAAGAGAGAAGAGLGKTAKGAGAADKQLKAARTRMNNISSAASGMSMVLSGVFGAQMLGNIGRMTIGLAAERQLMESLTASIMHDKAAAHDLFKTMDDLTNKSIISLDELAESMNTIKMSTNITNEQMKLAAGAVDHLGQVAYLQGFRGLQLQEKMKAALNGLTGEWKILENNFGITEEALKKLGWSGAADDVEGYVRALEKYLDIHADVSGAMNTFEGKLAKVEKQARIAGRMIGEQILPILEKALDFFMSLPAPVQRAIIQIGIVVGAFIGLAMVIAPVLMAVSSFISVAMAITGATTAGAAVVGLLGMAFTALTGPVGLAIIAIIAIVAAFILLYQNCKPFRDYINGVAKNIQIFVKRLREGRISAYLFGQYVARAFLLLLSPITLFWKLVEIALPTVKKKLKEIGESVKREFMAIPGKIRAALPAAIQAAINFAKGLVTGALRGLRIGSPGIIQISTIKEITDTIKRVDRLRSSAVRVGQRFGSDFANSFIRGSNGLGGNLSGYMTSNNRGTMTIRMEHDLKNVPAGTDEERLAEMINTSENNTLVRAIAKNNVFQDISQKIKGNIDSSSKRSVGL